MKKILNDNKMQYFKKNCIKIISWFVLCMSLLFSCVVFSACGDKYKDLRISFFSSAGEEIEEIEFVIESSESNNSQRVIIEFDGIDKKDVGQIVVYSLPNELVVASNYVYNGNTCSVDITPIMPSSGEAKLVVSHLSSNKKAEIDLNVEQRSNDLRLLNEKYIISIPEEEVDHYIDFTKLVHLLPEGSTDIVYFNVLENDAGVYPISAGEEFPNLYSGFTVAPTVENNSFVTIYPVPCLKNYVYEHETKYINKIITIYFRTTVDELTITPINEEYGDLDLNNLQLIANDKSLNTFKVDVNFENQPIFGNRTDGLSFYDMYELDIQSADASKITADVDSNYDIVITANTHTDENVEVQIILKPINFVGDISKVQKSIFVKGEVAADLIDVKKNGEALLSGENNIVETNIFDYYEEGNALGALFNFAPVANSGVEVHQDLNKMRIVVKPNILCAANREGNEITGLQVNRYTLEMHLYNDYLKFHYDSNSQTMISDEFSSDARIYIKYVKEVESAAESAEFGIEVRTTNNSTFKNWKALKSASVTISFNRLEGVKEMSLIAGYFDLSNQEGQGVPVGNNSEYIYLNRLEGLDNENSTVKYIEANSVKNIEGDAISKVDFNVEIEPLADCENSLLLFKGVAETDEKAGEGKEYRGLSELLYDYNSETTSNNSISLIFRRNTDLGDYKITFYQEGIEKASVICRVYEDLSELKAENISVEQNSKAFSNYNEDKSLKYADYDADYIVAAGQELELSINLSDAVINSNMVAGYTFSEYTVGLEVDDAITSVDNINDYFEVSNTGVENSCSLRFKKGTIVAGVKNYVYLTVYVNIKQFDNIVTIASDSKPIPYTLSFFIYEEITEEDISINHTSMTRYFSEYLGYAYIEKASAQLEIMMDDELWNYITLSENNLERDEDGNIVKTYDVDWRIDIVDGTTIVKSDRSYNIIFRQITGSTNYVRIVKAYVYQFENIFEFQCIFNVEKPIISQRVVINSNIKIKDDINQTYYINLKNGESYTIDASNYSSEGDVTHAETIIQVFDDEGSAYNARDFIDVNQTHGTIKVKQVEGAPQLKLVVFAKDALKYMPSSDKSGYNNPSSFIMDFTGAEKGKYTKAYFVMELMLSDGTEEHPYLIESANDFWQIDDSEELKTAHYTLMTSISLNNTTDTGSKIISGFEGNISTLVATKDNKGNPVSYNYYTIDGLTLNNSNKNLFSGFAGTISNIKFVADYNYTLTASAKSEEYLGIFDVNNGSLLDVSVYVNGKGEFSAEKVTYYFGGLVGYNQGRIEYKNQIGASGLISLNGGSSIYFGGIVGKNIGEIIGCEEEQETGELEGENSIQLNTSAGRQGVLSQIDITSFLTNASIGGVVGYNTYLVNPEDNADVKVGTIHNAFVQTNINATETSNVGGVIGTNKLNSLEKSVYYNDKYITIGNTDIANIFDYKDYAMYNVKSASQIIAKNNVGGIVGQDENGIYIECDFQVLNSSSKQISIVANENVGGIAGKSTYGYFAFCSVMSYWWNYEGLNGDKSKVVVDVADISGYNYVGGIVGLAVSDDKTASADENKDYVEKIGLQFKNTFVNKVLVVSSSVNAYLQATKKDDTTLLGNIGGILCSDTSKDHKAIAYNVYFIGKLEGATHYLEETTTKGAVDTTHYFCLDNNGNTIFNVAYTLNLVVEESSVELKKGYIKDDAEFIIESNPSISYWGWNTDVNGGYVFVSKNDSTDSNTNKLPIFDLSPESVNVSVKEPEAEGLEKVLLLYYYDFSQNTSLNDAQLLELKNENNNKDYIYKLEKDKDNNIQNVGLLNITTAPSGIGTVVVTVKSTNTNILDVTIDGRLLINGVGECDLVFSSMLNPNAGTIEDRTIHVVVDYPIGDKFNISTSKTDASKILDADDTTNITKGASRQYYVLTSGNVEKDFVVDGLEEEYAYRTKDNLNLKVLIKYEIDDADFDIASYVNISGFTGVPSYDDVSKSKILTFNVDNKTPFIISVNKYLENGVFDVEITPYLIIQKTEVTINKTAKFKLSTAEGASNVSFSYDDAVVYPNDTVYLTAHIKTDAAIYINADGTIDVASLQQMFDTLKSNSIDSNKTLEYENNLLLKIILTDKDNIKFNLYVDSSSYDKDAQIQTITLRIEFADMQLENEGKLSLILETQHGNSAVVNYVIIPQRIDKIEIKNFYYKNFEEKQADGTTIVTQKLVMDDVLKPDQAGRMIIDIVPENGYYDYLEISDITGDEEILFIQTDEEFKKAITAQFDPSSDKKGIKLISNPKDRIYILTQIDKGYSSKLHTIEIRAYSKDDILLYSQTKVIDVKMLPEIDVTYVLPDGSDGFVVNSNNVKVGSYLLANGVDANFRIKTYNANSPLEHKVEAETSTTYEFIQEVDSHYVLKSNVENINNDDIGKKVKITLKTYSYFDNGDFETAECSIEFTIVAFVIHGVSVNSSIDNSTTREIYGYYETPLKLKFYFDKDDISFYNSSAENAPFWDTVYENKSQEEINNLEDVNLRQIYSILKDINSYSDGTDGYSQGVNKYLILNDSSVDENGYKELTERLDKVVLKDNKLTVYEGYNKKTIEEDGKEKVVEDPRYLAVAFRIYYDGANGWKVENYQGETTSTNNQHYVINKNYKLNFRKVTPWYEPEIISTPEQFKEMSSGGRYLLANDITLKDYVPIDANLIEFDGNGYTITIESFGPFNEEEIQAGLFKQIYDEMVVKNVVVNYETKKVDGNWTLGAWNSSEKEYVDLCNNKEVNYTSVNFGGIAGVNNGIITNCYVKGQIVMRATTVEQKKFASGSDYAINFFVGGMVAVNGTTGYITNSTSELNIYSQSNIGGFVHTNQGKIVSCAVEKETTIYAYNTGLEKTIVVQVGGFAVENSNEISMSYVNLEKHTINNIDKGVMSAKDISAGFAYSNSGNIVDAYVYITNTGVNNNSFSGFANSNSGSISRAYTYINSGSRLDNNDTMFAPAGTEGLDNCIEFVLYRANYSNGIEQGLTTLDPQYRFNKEEYSKRNFAFGDNKNAVWYLDVGYMPKLTSTAEKIENAQGLLSISQKTTVEEGVQQTTYHVSFASYGTKQNPYIINSLESWNTYFTNDTNSYFRIVKDIDFVSFGDNPSTSTMTFKGNIQGNNMTLSNIMLYSTSSLESLGLFKNFESARDTEIENAVRNLTLTTTSIWASKTSSVGLLAGIVQDFNIYNITIDAPGVIMVGGNAVGGLAGVIAGEFDLDLINSNIGANSTRASTLYNYSILVSKNNKKNALYNLGDVYYAGSVAGILDGYSLTSFDVSSARSTNNKYYLVNNINVYDTITVIGDSVGAGFGFVGERVRVENINVNISGSLAGAQYSAGVAGENRGIISNAVVNISDNAFAQSKNVSAGIVGFNLGGYIKNVEVTAKIEMSGYGKIVGGIVGRDIYGRIDNAYFDGTLNAYFVGGFVGASYTNSILVNATTGAGTLSSSCKADNRYLVPTKQVEYIDVELGETGDEPDIGPYNNLSLSQATWDYLLKTSNEYYSYQQKEESSSFDEIVIKKKVLGVIVGLGYKAFGTDYQLDVDTANKVVTFASVTDGEIKIVTAGADEVIEVVLQKETLESNEIKFNFMEIRAVAYTISTPSSGSENKDETVVPVDIARVMYLTGAISQAFDSWNNKYSDDFIIVAKTIPTATTLSATPETE